MSDLYPNLGTFIAIGLVFAPLAGAMAFLITYEEYSHHGLTKSRILRFSLEAAAVGGGMILALMVVAGFFIGRWGT